MHQGFFQVGFDLNDELYWIPIIAVKCNDAYCSWSIQFVTSNTIGLYFLFIFLSLALWLCLKKCSEKQGAGGASADRSQWSHSD